MSGIIDQLDSGSSLTCGGWWDAYDPGTVTIRDGTADRVDEITDKSDGGWDLVNEDGTDTDHPQLVAGGIRFTEDGDHHLRNTSFSQDWDSVTVFASFTFRDDPHHTVLVAQSNGGVDADFMIMLRKATGNAMNWQYNVGKGSAQTRTVNVADVFVQDVKRVMTFIVSPTADDYVRLRISAHTSATNNAIVEMYDSDEVTDAASSGGMIGSSADDGLYVNAHTATSPAYTAGLDLHELALFDGVCSETEITRIENYMLHHGPSKSPRQSPPGIGLGVNARR